MRTFLGVDIGIRNLAMVEIGVSEAGQIDSVQVNLLDLGGNKTSILKILQLDVLHKYFDTCFEGVYIEQQSNRSAKCFGLMCSFFLGFTRGSKECKVVDPKNKFKRAKDLGIEAASMYTKKNSTYKLRKDCAVKMVKEICQVLNLQNPMQPYKKQDDVADAFLYAFFGAHKHLDLDPFTKATYEYIDLG